MSPYRTHPQKRDPVLDSGARAASYRAARRRLAAAGVLVAIGAAASPLALRWLRHERPRREAPAELLRAVAAFPESPPELRPSVPLEPLLAADAPDRLAVLSPAETALNLRASEPLVVRFNRPMVDGARVGKPLDREVIVLDPPVRGRQVWTSRSSLSFEPEGWTATRTASLTLSPELRSLAGEVVEDFEPRTVVLDAGPRLLQAAGGGRILPGEPLRLLFSGHVDPSALAPQLMMYEVDGGRRMVPFQAVGRAVDAKGRTPIDLELGRKLEPGARIAVAVAPPLSHGGATPRVVEVELAPRPRLEGIGCADDATEVSQCEASGPPGRVIDIGDTLVLLSTADLREPPAGAVKTSPALPALALTLDDRRRLRVRGDWDPGQVYELRFAGLETADGHALARTPPLAVRSRGRTPEVRFEAGRRTYEHDAAPRIPFAAIHVDDGELRIGRVPPGREIEAALWPSRWLADDRASDWSSLPLQPLAPSARPNRWGRGAFDWSEPTPSRAPMGVIALLPDRAPREPGAIPAAFVQRTDLAIDARRLARGVRVWVTSLATAEPAGGARVTLADDAGRVCGEGDADEHGYAWLDPGGCILDHEIAVRAVRGDDRAVLVLDPRTSMGPQRLGLTPGAPPPRAEAWVASVLADRGIVRPGETVHTRAVVREADGAALYAPERGSVRALLFGPAGEAPIAERASTLSPFGTSAADFELDEGAEPGVYRVEVRRAGQTAALGTASFTVGDYQPPTLRVDLESPRLDLVDGDPLRVGVTARHLFGPPAAGLGARWSFVREGGGDHAARWEPYAFGPAGISPRPGTIAAGELALDGAGAGAVETAVALSAPVREDVLLEVTIADASGRTTSARRGFHAYPADFEVGVRRSPAWIEGGAPLDVETIVIAHDDTPAAGRRVEARILREGWHRYWEWAGGGREEAEDGSYKERRARKTEVVHRCAQTSTAEPVHCAWTPDRPGTYLLEATTRDAGGRRSTASQRVYVAAPGEHPDRDPPGTAVALTPSKRRWDVGETAEIAFESPFEEAEALLEVEREGVLFAERTRVPAGGHVFRFEVTPSMVPNAFVALTLVRPRTGPPGEPLDLAAPDLRVGMTEIDVRPTTAPLDVSVAVPAATATAGDDVPIRVEVTDRSGAGVAAEVALFAVDEGTLRLTGYHAPDPLDGLLPRLAPSFAWEDLRRSLVSRLEPSLLPSPGGDGGDGEAAPPPRREDRERFDPTPLWLPHLVTDASGRADAVLHLPARPTQYRIMAVAVDAGAGAGKGETTLTASMPVVVRPALPGFAAAGDRFEAAAFIHNTEDEPVDVEVTPVVDGVPREPQTVHLGPYAEERVSEWIAPDRAQPLTVRFEARSEGGAALAEATVEVIPRGREVRSEAVGAVDGSRRVALRVPEGAIAGSGALTLTVAAHPFVGFDVSFERLLAGDAGVEPTAASVVALAAYAALDLSRGASGRRPGRVSAEEVLARGAAATGRLVRLQTPSGGFGAFSRSDAPDPYLTAYALHALVAARRAGFTAGHAAADRARDHLAEVVRGAGFVDRGEGGRDDLAFALRVLAEAGAPDADRVKALFDQRELLSPYGLAELALAMDPSDARRDTLVLEAAERVLATRADERTTPHVLRWYDSGARTLGAVLEAAASADLAAVDAGAGASRLLATRAGDASWWTTHETSHALAALAAYAATVRAEAPIAPRVRVDGVPIAPAEQDQDSAFYHLPAALPSGASHELALEVEGTAWFALAGSWMVPLGAADEVARGERATLHRVLEDATGKPLGRDARVKLGDLVRVRLFLYTEEAPPYLAVRDRLAGGLEPLDASHETSPRAALHALLGMGPDDDVLDARGHWAERSLDALSHRAFLPTEAAFYLAEGQSGLRELTYGARATAVGTFVLPPAELEALYSPGFTARSAAATITVEP